MPDHVRPSEYPTDELADLGVRTAEWLAPRLRAFARITRSYPRNISYEAWLDEIERMARGLDLLRVDMPTADQVAERDAALALLARRLPDLWS